MLCSRPILFLESHIFLFIRNDLVILSDCALNFQEMINRLKAVVVENTNLILGYLEEYVW